jgi:5'-nucleotidase / UDP-sugar diphosphatase
MHIKIILLSLLVLLWIAFGQSDSGTKKIYLFYTNDLHGGITEQEADFLNPNFPPLLGGGASAANIIFQYREQAEKEGNIVLLLDAGDIFQGTPIGTQTAGKAVVDYMNLVGYDAVTAGNHDFDLGKEVFINLTKQANFPILSANLLDKTTGDHFSHIEPYILLERGGLKIGVFGITTKATEQMSFPKHIEGLQFSEEIPAAQAAVDSLRAMGADLVVGLVHLGLPYDPEAGYSAMMEAKQQGQIRQSYVNAMEMAHYVQGIDILMGGHIHRGYHEPWVDPVNHTLVFQNYGNGGNLGLAILEIDQRTRTIVGYDLPATDSGLLLLTQDQFWPHQEIYASIKEVQDEIEKGYDEMLGITEYPLTRGQGEAPLNNLICDAMIAATGADFSFTNFGGIRAEIRMGAITPRDIFKVLPFGNSIVVLQLQGSFLRQLIENRIAGNRSGLAIGGGRIFYERDRDDGDKITSFFIGQQPLDPDKTYRVATTDYLAEGNSGMADLAELPQQFVDNTGILLRDALSQYIRQQSPLRVKTDGRWQRK